MADTSSDKSPHQLPKWAKLVLSEVRRPVKRSSLVGTQETRR
jgi:hypothetical protein